CKPLSTDLMALVIPTMKASSTPIRQLGGRYASVFIGFRPDIMSFKSSFRQSRRTSTATETAARLSSEQLWLEPNATMACPIVGSREGRSESSMYIDKHARGRTYRKPCPLTRRRWFPPWPPQFGYLAYTSTQGPSAHHMGVVTCWVSGFVCVLPGCRLWRSPSF